VTDISSRLFPCGCTVFTVLLDNSCCSRLCFAAIPQYTLETHTTTTAKLRQAAKMGKVSEAERQRHVQEHTEQVRRSKVLAQRLKC
jgi:hypothetical protein